MLIKKLILVWHCIIFVLGNKQDVNIAIDISGSMVANDELVEEKLVSFILTVVNLLHIKNLNLVYFSMEDTVIREYDKDLPILCEEVKTHPYYGMGTDIILLNNKMQELGTPCIILSDGFYPTEDVEIYHPTLWLDLYEKKINRRSF